VSPQRGTGSPEGVRVRVRAPRRRRPGTLPPWLGLVLAAATLFYLVAHLSIVTGVWTVHGSAAGSANMLVRDAVALVGWVLAIAALALLGYRGRWSIVILPVVIFLLARPSVFHAFTDPSYAAPRGERVEANQLKAERARLSTLQRAFDEERLRVVFDGDPPPLPDPRREAELRDRSERGWIVRAAGQFTVWVSPLMLVLAFLWARDPRQTRLFRDHKAWPFFGTVGLFLVLTLFFVELGRVRGTTPWELFLPIFIGAWAAVLADDSYNLGRLGGVVTPRRLAGLLLFGALPLVPFLIIRELGLSVVLAGSLAAMLLVGTRRGWWAGLMLAVWALLVLAAFNLDPRSATRLDLAYAPYKELQTMSEEEAERWAASLHQFKLFDANLLAGGVVGPGPGRGHGETAPNAADDGFITLFAAQHGLLGGMALVLLYTLFLLEMMSVAMRERGAFERTLVTGLALVIAIPFWLAVLGGVRVIPLTGVAAAFAAHGGAKLLASALAVGAIAGISHRRGLEEASTGAEEGVRVR
jgi:cell division protein FtsW (lipid II flippase)